MSARRRLDDEEERVGLDEDAFVAAPFRPVVSLRPEVSWRQARKVSSRPIGAAARRFTDSRAVYAGVPERRFTAPMTSSTIMATTPPWTRSGGPWNIASTVVVAITDAAPSRRRSRPTEAGCSRPPAAEKGSNSRPAPSARGAGLPARNSATPGMEEKSCSLSRGVPLSTRRASSSAARASRRSSASGISTPATARLSRRRAAAASSSADQSRTAGDDSGGGQRARPPDRWRGGPGPATLCLERSLQ
jgi:hypothetical protein